MNDLQAKLKQAEAKIEANDADIQSIVSNKLDNEAEVIRIKAEIAEAKKPKLRHGDYGPICNSCEGRDGEMGIMVEDRNRGLRLMGVDCLSSVESRVSISEVYGNQLDDLKAMQEDVTENERFEFITDTAGFRASLAIQMSNAAVWLYTTDGKGVQLEAQKLSELKSLICRTEATLKRQAK